MIEMYISPENTLFGSFLGCEYPEASLMDDAMFQP